MTHAATDARSPDRLAREHFLPAGASVTVLHQTLRRLIPVHWHDFYEVGFVLAGRGTHAVNGEAAALLRGSLFFLTPTDFHTIMPQADHPVELFNVILTEDLLGEELQRFLYGELHGHTARLDGSEVAEIEAVFRRIADEVSMQHIGHTLAVQGDLQRILVTLVRHVAAQGASDQLVSQAIPLPAMWRVLAYIHHHFREPLTLEDAARQAGFTATYFSERFHQVTGLSFQRYLQDERLRFAMALLSATDLSVTEICHAAGFNTLAHFDRVFKRKFGQSPSIMRRLSVPLIE